MVEREVLINEFDELRWEQMNLGDVFINRGWGNICTLRGKPNWAIDDARDADRSKAKGTDREGWDDDRNEDFYILIKSDSTQIERKNLALSSSTNKTKRKTSYTRIRRLICGEILIKRTRKQGQKRHIIELREREREIERLMCRKSVGMKLQLLFLALFLSGIHFIDSFTDPNDVAVLSALKAAWKNTPPSWGHSDDPCGLHGRWEGVTCNNSTFRVTAL
ncbi:uncharacterized protein LOC121242262 [Juglans microcarpa x Juglans regia]|uniref:uncharacterized protein LOC121242262 n=1 Tax=Juglans microcarpa x Juglans regia TaxID=2249226 RepID=UPI001B7E56AC|nr:uncharacterized protein LOC121242262 [Juglans microcarpa x Juglans regia]